MKPTVAQAAPYPIEVKAGESYFWCSCGQSKKQPFCDGSHQGTSFAPVKWQATENKTVYFCGCKQTKNSPLCDGAHKALTA